MKNKQNIQCVLIMAGGTGGHVFPGLAIANYFSDRNIKVHWLGTKDGLEANIIPATSYPFHSINIKGLRGKGLKKQILAPFNITSAVLQAMKVIRKVKPDIVIGMGGFASGPGGIAARLMRYPLIIHEQNAKVGLTNYILSRFANKVLEGFPNSFSTQSKVITVGNPVRHEIEQLPPPHIRFKKGLPFRLLILGGSLGAKPINELVPKALARLGTKERPVVIHQTGDKHLIETQLRYARVGVQVMLRSFIKDMSEPYAWADLVLCRAGAITVAELCTVGLGAIFVPFPYAVDDHQTANANYMVEKGAAVLIPQQDLKEEMLAETLLDFARSPEKRIEMARAAFDLRKPNVPKKIYEICEEVCH